MFLNKDDDDDDDDDDLFIRGSPGFCAFVGAIRDDSSL